jgi:hypothetical protein
LRGGRQEIADANVVHLLKTLGIASVVAALFILASIATAGGAAGIGALLFAGGAVASGATAAASWDKYGDLAAAHAATVDPELALVSGEQVDDAMIGAILDTVFAFVDVWQGVKGAYVGIKGGKAILEAGKVGAEASTKVALRNLAKAGNAKEVVTKAVAELGHEQASLSPAVYELAQIVGKEATSASGCYWARLGC